MLHINVLVHCDYYHCSRVIAVTVGKVCDAQRPSKNRWRNLRTGLHSLKALSLRAAHPFPAPRGFLPQAEQLLGKRLFSYCRFSLSLSCLEMPILCTPGARYLSQWLQCSSNRCDSTPKLNVLFGKKAQVTHLSGNQIISS